MKNKGKEKLETADIGKIMKRLECDEALQTITYFLLFGILLILWSADKMPGVL